MTYSPAITPTPLANCSVSLLLPKLASPCNAKQLFQLWPPHPIPIVNIRYCIHNPENYNERGLTRENRII